MAARVTHCVVILLLLMVAIPGGNAARTKHRDQAVDPAELIQRASENQVNALESAAYFHYFEKIEWSWGSETREVIETAQGRADRIVEFDDQPLAPDQVSKQERRLASLLRDPKAVRHGFEEQRAELKRRVRMMKAFPSAFVFEPEGEQDGLLKFRFRPNRSFSPRDRETQVYRAMQGTVWVDPDQEMLTSIDGVLTRDISFGWGIFGRLHKGGHYHVEQREVEPGVWRITTLALDLKLRVFLNTSHLLRKEQNSEFLPTPPHTSYQEAIERLLESPAEPDR